jgi:hypothetical protein
MAAVGLMARAFLAGGIINRMTPVGRKEIFDSNVFLFDEDGLQAAAYSFFFHALPVGRLTSHNCELFFVNP